MQWILVTAIFYYNFISIETLTDENTQESTVHSNTQLSAVSKVTLFKRQSSWKTWYLLSIFFNKRLRLSKIISRIIFWWTDQWTDQWTTWVTWVTEKRTGLQRYMFMGISNNYVIIIDLIYSMYMDKIIQLELEITDISEQVGELHNIKCHYYSLALICQLREMSCFSREMT